MEGVDKTFYATRADADVSFTVGAGEIVSLLGENGAGRSTIIKVLAGVHHADAGRILLRGEDVERPGVRSRISFVHQDLGLVERMTVAENIAQVHGARAAGAGRAHRVAARG